MVIKDRRVLENLVKVEEEPVCIEGHFIAHREENKNYLMQPEYKYKCCHSRECGYKLNEEKENYCVWHMRQNKVFSFYKIKNDN